jgi:hypothetical protein
MLNSVLLVLVASKECVVHLEHLLLSASGQPPLLLVPNKHHLPLFQTDIRYGAQTLLPTGSARSCTQIPLEVQFSHFFHTSAKSYARPRNYSVCS